MDLDTTNTGLSRRELLQAMSLVVGGMLLPSAITRAQEGQLFYPNRFALVTLQAIEEIIGQNGMSALLETAGLPNLIGNYPPDNMDREFDFDDFAAIRFALDEIWGPRGGRATATRAGRAALRIGLQAYGQDINIDDSFSELPVDWKMLISLFKIASGVREHSDQISNLTEEGDHYVFTLEQCPMCWNRTADHAVCQLGQGFLQEALFWITDGNVFDIEISTCIAQGHDMGRYLISKEPSG